MIKQIVFSEWTVMRWIRLIAGIGLLISGFQDHDQLMGIFGALFLFQAVFNTGCCGTSSCSNTYPTNAKSHETKDIVYEEVK